MQRVHWLQYMVKIIKSTELKKKKEPTGKQSINRKQSRVKKCGFKCLTLTLPICETLEQTGSL